MPKDKDCVRCQLPFPASLRYFPSAQTTKDRLSSWCRCCTREYNKKRSESLEVKKKSPLKNPAQCLLCGEFQSTALFHHRYCDSCKEKRKQIGETYRTEAYMTRYVARQAAKIGLLPTPSVCSGCKKEGRLQAHHFNGYGLAHVFEVQWLCTACHYGVHNPSSLK